MVNREKIDKCQVVSDVQNFYKNKPQAARNKGFRTYVDSKALTSKP